MSILPASCSRILANNVNAARDAAITVSAQRASTDVRLVRASKRGSGKALASGPFTGADDSVIDVEIVDVSSGALSTSAPVVAGVGSGTLTVGPLAAGAVAEEISVTLLDAGDPPVAATFDFFGYEIAAKAVGTVGNTIGMTVARNLTAAPLGAVLEAITAGTTELSGPQWDWGQPTASGGSIPPDALRVRFVGHPTVHRSWREWDGAAWLYKLDPAPAFDIDADTVVEQISGDYTITVTDAITETYTAISVYDFLAAVRARSELLDVRAAVAADRAPGGMAVTEIPLRSDAYALPAQIKTKVDTRIALGAVRAGNPTENVIVKHLGKDAWSVRGAATGEWPAARTGEGYTAGPVGFTILRKTEIAQSLAARITGKYTPTSRTDADPGLPAICFKPLVLGAKATDKTITFTWTKRPPAECFCDNLPALRLSAECLGLDIGGAEMALDAEHQSRLVALYAWYAEFTGSNTGIDTIPSDPALLMTSLDSRVATKRMIADPEALRLADAAVAEFYEGLEDVYASLDGRTQWDAYFAALDTLLSDVEGLASDDDIANFTRAESFTGIHGHASSLSARIPGIEAAIGFFRQRWAAQMDHCRVVSGVLPKSTAGSDAGACWRDVGDPFYWADNDGFYLPVFNNVAYVSAIKTDEGQILSTQEFGFGIVTQCEHRLKEGDTITITVSGTANAAEYGDDDEIIIPVVAAGAARLSGGEDGDATQVWTVRGTASGPLPDWLYAPGAPADYTHGPAPLTLKPGGIPFAVGDRISFSVAGGTLRWRRDGGAWTAGDVYDTTHDLGDGLTLTTTPGSAPAFFAGDAWQFDARATFGPARMRAPVPGDAFAWDGDAVVIDVDLGAATAAEAVMLGLLDVPSDVSIIISGGQLAVGEWSVPAERGEGLALARIPSQQVRYLRVAITGAVTGGRIGWLWAGMGWAPTVEANDVPIKMEYHITRSDALNGGGLYRGYGIGSTWTWNISEGGALLKNEVTALKEMLRHIMSNGLEPVALVPNILEPDTASISRLDAETIDMTDLYNLAGVTLPRVMSVSLPFSGVAL